MPRSTPVEGEHLDPELAPDPGEGPVEVVVHPIPGPGPGHAPGLGDQTRKGWKYPKKRSRKLREMHPCDNLPVLLQPEKPQEAPDGYGGAEERPRVGEDLIGERGGAAEHDVHRVMSAEEAFGLGVTWGRSLQPRIGAPVLGQPFGECEVGVGLLVLQHSPCRIAPERSRDRECSPSSTLTGARSAACSTDVLRSHLVAARRANRLFFAHRPGHQTGGHPLHGIRRGAG